MTLLSEKQIPRGLMPARSDKHSWGIRLGERRALSRHSDNPLLQQTGIDG
jgi:hypothetical protein